MAADHRQSEADLLQKLATRMRESLLPVDQPFANGDLEQAVALVLETATRRTAGEPAISITDGAQGSGEGHDATVAAFRAHTLVAVKIVRVQVMRPSPGLAVIGRSNSQ